MFKKLFLSLIAAFLGRAAVAAKPAAVPANSEDFDLYLLVGQSNMAGRGIPTDADRQPASRVLVFNKSDEWARQGEPIHFDKSMVGVGPGFAFGKLMAQKYPTKTIGLIPCAVGGTPIERWKPGADLFEAAVRRAKLAMERGRLKGILWHQGEASSDKQKTASIYASELCQVVEGFRKALDTPNAPFIVGRLGEYLYTRSGNKSPFAYMVNEQIDTLPSLVPNTAVVSSKGLMHNGDELHFDADSQREFGKRYFETFVLLTEKARIK